MACTYEDLLREAKHDVGPAYYGVGLPNAYAPQFMAAFTNGYYNFINAMWAGYSSAGCSWWANRVNHWTNQIAANNYGPYILARKQAKILFAQHMHSICGCFGPVPKLAFGGVIKDFNLDTNDIKATGETRDLSITGDSGALFSLEIKSGVNYYNFQTNLFQTAQTKLHDINIVGGVYNTSIIFPSVSAGTQYDIYLMANGDTEHDEYEEVRFADGSMDINSTTGSNSKLVQKVIYQTLDATITINGYSPNETVTGATTSTTIAVKRNGSVSKIPFNYTFTATSTRTLSINKQPTTKDVMAFVAATVGASPIDIPGENVYPAVSNTDVVDGTGFAAATVNKFVMDTNVADKMVVGDKITITTTDLTDTINGAVTSGIKVVMDNNVATKMAVGDRITNSGAPNVYLFDNIVTVAALDPDGDNVKEFSMSEAVGLADGLALVFTPKCNRELFTVAELNPDEDNAKEFSYVDAAGGTSSRLGVMDNARLSFSNQRNHKWPISSTTVDLSKITAGMRQLKSSFFTSTPTVRDYVEQIVVFEGEVGEKFIEKVRVPAVDTLEIKPLIVRDATTKVVTTTVGTSSNPISITFDKQALLTFGGGANAKIFSYGEDEINHLTGYDVEFSDLAVTLTEVSTTTTAAVSASTSVPVTQRAGIMDVISSVSGIGIDSAVTNPTVASGAGSVTGAGTIVLSAAQTLEDGITLTFPGASTIATVSGYVKVNNTGNEDVVLRFDLEKFLTMH